MTRLAISTSRSVTQSTPSRMKAIQQRQLPLTENGAARSFSSPSLRDRLANTVNRASPLQQPDTVSVPVLYKARLPYNYEIKDIHEIAKQCASPVVGNLYSTTVVIKPCRPPLVQSGEMQISTNQLRSLGLTRTQMESLVHYWCSLVCNPLQFFKRLHPLESVLSQKIKEHGAPPIAVHRPQFLISGVGHWLMGPPIEWEGLSSIVEIFKQTLLETENNQGLNTKGLPVFVSLVETQSANDFVAKGHVFADYVKLTRMLMHGENTHRLSIQALIHSLEGTEFSGLLKPKDILKLLIRLSVRAEWAWNFLLDTNADMLGLLRVFSYDRHGLENMTYFNYSCRSPFVFQSLMCFGDELGVPYLSLCLRASFWLAIQQMVKRIEENPNKIKIDNQTAYELVISGLSSSKNVSPGDLGQTYPFTESPEEALSNKNYQRYPGVSSPGIKIEKFRKS